MSDWKTSLDKYLTREPDCSFDNWVEEIDEKYSDDFFNKNNIWITDYDGQCNKWLNELWRKGLKACLTAYRYKRIFPP